jgi:ribosomal protein S18 acetylase RimI-like enzyme
MNPKAYAEAGHKVQYCNHLDRNSLMPLIIRPCTPDDVGDIIPLMFSAGPDAFKYVFSVNSELEALDFLRASFVKGDGEFGYMDHVVALDNDEIVALVGMRSAQDNLKYTLSAAKGIFKFYGLLNGLRVVVRGLRFERIVSPPKKSVLCLHNLGVKEGLRGKGYGRQLIAWFMQQAGQQSVTAVGLDVAQTNPRAKALYLELGFTVKSITQGTLSNQYGRGVTHEHMESSELRLRYQSY